MPQLQQEERVNEKRWYERSTSDLFWTALAWLLAFGFVLLIRVCVTIIFGVVLKLCGWRDLTGLADPEDSEGWEVTPIFLHIRSLFPDGGQ